MDDITTRAIVIGVSVFVTLTIVTLVITMFFQMQEIYGIVATTDTSIYSAFDDIYAMYYGRTMSGLGLLNTIKRYEDRTDIDVVVVYPGSTKIKQHVESSNASNTSKTPLRESVYLKSLMEQNKEYKYETKYYVTVEGSVNTQIKIIFQTI